MTMPSDDTDPIKTITREDIPTLQRLTGLVLNGAEVKGLGLQRRIGLRMFGKFLYFVIYLCEQHGTVGPSDVTRWELGWNWAARRG